MSIKKQIIISNIAMIIIPVIVAAIVCLVGMNTVVSKYWYTLEDFFENENGLTSAQSLIYAYQEELWDANSFGEDGEGGDNAEESIRKMNSLEEQLTVMGYNISIIIDGKETYTTLNDEDKRAISEHAPNIDSVRSLATGVGDTSIIKCPFEEDGRTCEIIAVNVGRNVHDENGSYIEKYVLNFVLIFVLLFLAAVVATNVVLSGKITNKILPPLKKLSEGTEKVREGDLDFPIEYERNDEFGQVCADFNEMRIHLKESVETRLQYEEARREMISGISHDLRTPLTSIMGYSEGLLDGIANTDEKRKTYCEAINMRAMDMERLINNLSEYNKTFDGSLRYDLEDTDFGSYLREFFQKNMEEFSHKSINVQIDIPNDIQTVKLDGGEFKRVLDNLIDNTVKYRTKESSQIRVKLRYLQDEAILCIADDGPGVGKESYDKIFDTFYRGDPARTKCEDGSGMGLSIVKEIIHGHNGSVRAYDAAGLTIEIKLPLELK